VYPGKLIPLQPQVATFESLEGEQTARQMFTSPQ